MQEKLFLESCFPTQFYSFNPALGDSIYLCDVDSHQKFEELSPRIETYNSQILYELHFIEP